MHDLDLFKELDPGILGKNFLNALLSIQKVKRGSIWIRKKNTIVCVEAAGAESENILGVKLGQDQTSIVGWVIKNRQMTVAETKSDRRHCRELEDNFAVKSSLILCFPLFSRENKVYGAVQIIDTTPSRKLLNLDEKYLSTLQNLVDICSIALDNAMLFSREKNRARNLASALSRVEKNSAIIGQSPSFLKSMGLVNSYAKTDFHVLITGDSGTGKELAAQELHRLSRRRGNPFLVQNCSAIPETLLESELFGYKKGAFTGATRDKIGLFEAADGGTVFLDEIGDMPMETQAGLLRVLQKNEIKPVGETRVRYVDLRVVAATNKDIQKMVAEKRFRQDLFYRLSVLPLHLPALRDRREDIPLLIRYFLEKEAAGSSLDHKKMSPDAMHYLVAYDWPGNIRELENLIRYLMVISPDETIVPEDIPRHVRASKAISGQPDPETALQDPSPSSAFVKELSTLSWPDMEQAYVEALLEKHNWNVTWAARAAGVIRSTFASRMRKLGIRRNPGRPELP